MVDHETRHRICVNCLQQQGLPLPPGEPAIIADAGGTPSMERCCYCGKYTLIDLARSDVPEDVPHNRRDPAWLAAAGIKPEELFKSEEDDPRVIQDQ